MLTIEGREITPSRLIRAVNDVVIKGVDENGDDLPDRHYMAMSHGNVHYLFTDPYLECDCQDFIYRGDVICKHLIKVLIMEKHPIMVRYLQEIGIET